MEDSLETSVDAVDVDSVDKETLLDSSVCAEDTVVTSVEVPSLGKIVEAPSVDPSVELVASVVSGGENEGLLSSTVGVELSVEEADSDGASVEEDV